MSSENEYSSEFYQIKNKIPVEEWIKWCHENGYRYEIKESRFTIFTLQPQENSYHRNSDGSYPHLKPIKDEK